METLHPTPYTLHQVVHEKRVVHGDLKPANFLMVNKELKLIDFGIAKQIESNDTSKSFPARVRKRVPSKFCQRDFPRRAS